MRLRDWSICILASALVSCGGGGGGSDSPGSPPPTNTEDRAVLTASVATNPVPSSWNTDINFVVSNPSSRNANNVELTVTLGMGMLRAGLQCTASNGATCPDTPNSLIVDTIPSGGSL